MGDIDPCFQAMEEHCNEEMFAAGREPWDDFHEVKITKIEIETVKAYLVEFDSGFQKWFPKSQCNVVGGVMLHIPEWLHEQTVKEMRSNSKKKVKKYKVACKRCTSKNVIWKETVDGWRLYDKKEDILHVCYDKVPAGIR